MEHVKRLTRLKLASAVYLISTFTMGIVVMNSTTGITVLSHVSSSAQTEYGIVSILA